MALDAFSLAALETIGLDAATLAALESISVTNFPADYPDAAVLAKIEAVRALLAATLTIAGTVAVSNFPASQPVSGTVALDAPTLAALEVIGLDAATLAALESISIANFPADYPSAAVLAKVEAVRALLAGTLTVTGTVGVSGSVEVVNDVGNPLPVSGTVTLDGPTLAALETITVLISAGQIVGLDSATLAALEAITVSGTVALDSSTLAALESITVAGTVALDAPTLAALESITATISGTVAVSGTVTVANPTTDPETGLAKDATLTNGTQTTKAIDAAETAGLLIATFDFTATGTAQSIVAAPGGTSLLRLKRISPTFAIRSANSEPILKLKVGSVIAQQGNALVGRFAITAATSANAITLDIDILDAGGHVSGTVYYEVV